MCARFVSYWESGTIVTLELAHARAGAVSLRSRVSQLAPVFLFVCFLNCRRVRVWRGCLSRVALEVEEGTEKRAG